MTTTRPSEWSIVYGLAICSAPECSGRWVTSYHIESKQRIAGGTFYIQRDALKSDILARDPANYPYGRGPQGDAVHIYNYVHLVRGGLNNSAN